MIDFAGRVAGKTGVVSVCHCIASRHELREAGAMLADLVEFFRRIADATTDVAVVGRRY